MSILVLTSDTLIGTPATGNLEYNGQFYGTDSNAARAQMQRITLGTVNSGGTSPFPSSGGPTSVTFGSLPSWIKRITVMFNGVSTSGTSGLLVQLGAGSVTNSGYIGSCGNRGTNDTFFSTGFIINVGAVAAALTNSGNLTVCTSGSNTWSETSIISNNSTNAPCFGSGYIALSGTLDRVVITTVGGDTFDAGSINILYEG